MGNFWIMWVPVIIIAVVWYAYSAGGFIGGWLQGILDPILKLGHSILNFFFGV
jgi:hypothetical protein